MFQLRRSAPHLTLSWASSLLNRNQYICSANQWTGFYMMVIFVKKELSLMQIYVKKLIRRGTFRTLSIIFDGSFSWKQLTGKTGCPMKREYIFPGFSKDFWTLILGIFKCFFALFFNRSKIREEFKLKNDRITHCTVRHRQTLVSWV